MGYKIKLGISVVIIFSVILSSNSNLDLPFLSGQDNTSNNIANDTSIKTDFLNIGHFPNLNHAQAIIGIETGDFNKTFNMKHNLSDITISSNFFTSERSILEALYAESIDVAYVNPNTIIDGYILLGDQDFQIISGASSGGISFIVRNDSGIETINDLGGKKFASPQLGNTQDVALRKYLLDNGFNTVENGGNVTVVALKPGDIISQFQNKEIDGAWVPEPITTILKQQANGAILVDERDLWPDGKIVTGNVIVRTDYLRDNPDVIKRVLEAHVDETLWINQNLLKTNNTDTDKQNEMEIVSAFNQGLMNITGKTYPDNVLGEAFSRLEFTPDPLPNSLLKIAEDAEELGFIKKGSDWHKEFSKIYDLTLLNKVLDEKGLSKISDYYFKNQSNF